MKSYQLTRRAFTDLTGILRRSLKEQGPQEAERLEQSLTAAFDRLSATPGLGHKRSDLTARALYFYLDEPYHLLYRRGTDPLQIVAILHASRDIRTILQKR